MGAGRPARVPRTGRARCPRWSDEALTEFLAGRLREQRPIRLAHEGGRNGWDRVRSAAIRLIRDRAELGAPVPTPVRVDLDGYQGTTDLCHIAHQELEGGCSPPPLRVLREQVKTGRILLLCKGKVGARWRGSLRDDVERLGSGAQISLHASNLDKRDAPEEMQWARLLPSLGAQRAAWRTTVASAMAIIAVLGVLLFRWMLLPWWQAAPLREFYGDFRGIMCIGSADVTTRDGKRTRDYIGIGDAKAVPELARCLDEIGGTVALDTTSDLPHDPFERSGAPREDAVLIGGPSMNERTLYLLAALHGLSAAEARHPSAQVPGWGYAFVVGDASEQPIPNALSRLRHDVECRPKDGLGILDVESGRLFPVESQVAGAKPGAMYQATGKEYGLVIKVERRLANSSKHTIIVLMGYDDAGTLAAARAATDADLVKRMNVAQGRRPGSNYIEMLVEADAAHPGARPIVVSLPHNPRARTINW